jgi:hypothetical protein
LTIDSSRVSSSVLSHPFSGYSQQWDLSDQSVKFAQPLCLVSGRKLAEMFKFTLCVLHEV